MSAFNERLERIRELIHSRDLDAIVLRRNPNLAWLTGGRVHVPTAIDAACLDFVVTKTEAYVVTNVIEAPRLIAEELPQGIEVRTVQWWEARDSLLPIGESVASDQPSSGRIDLGIEIEILRQSLVQEDIERFRAVCVDTAVALGKAMRSISPQDREIDVAGKITNELWQNDLEVAFLGVAGQRRAPLMRHPLPTTEAVGNRVVASICAKRKGLIASVTRITHFGEIGNPYADYEALLHVEAEMLNTTVTGVPFSRPIAVATLAYKKYGFDEVEWQKHHQGGPTGYLPRDWPANLQSTRLILDHQPISWNPTGKGWKVEDTIISNGASIEILTLDPLWPMVVVDGRARPGILVL